QSPMDVSRLLDTRAREILCQAILRGEEPPSEVETRAARDDARKRALRAEAALEATMRRWEETSQQMDNHRAVLDPAKAAAARELNEQRAALRLQAAAVRQTLEDHSIDKEQLASRMDENDRLDADINRLLRVIEGVKEKENLFKGIGALQVAQPAGETTQPEEKNRVAESIESSDVEMA
ncbi:hypothetical protein PMAYCL1PPCAC_22495, partial [Pristionchus mayeri]